MNVVEKILQAHLVTGTPQAGAEVGIRIDQTLTQDATGTMTYLQFEALGLPRVKTELSVSYVDHNTLQQGFENADDHLYLQSVAAKHGVLFSRPGNGICHQVHLERFGVPGKTLLGSDSHTPTGGGIGMLAIGAGGLEVALAMAGVPFPMAWPKVVRINLNGKLPAWVTAKDIILQVLSLLTSKGNVGWVVEYGGSGLKHLSVPERATITNMGAELGVTTSVFPSDAVTRAFLAAQGRAKQWRELLPDKDAKYDRTINIDLAKLVPLAAAPHNPANIVTVAALKKKAVNQVVIGSCTNSSYTDLMLAAKVLKGKTVHPAVSLIVAPGSRQVLEMIARNGALADLVQAGARLAESACGFCIGSGHAPASGTVTLRTSNRNFAGRSGTADAEVYLVSPAVAAASALTGTVADPRALGRFPKITLPKKFIVDDRMIVLPPKNGSKVVVRRGPNIGPPPQVPALPADLTGAVVLKLGDMITTDDIMPAGAFLKFRSNIPKYAQYVFYRQDPKFHEQAAALRDAGKAAFVVAGLSYGQGSSREHAAICPMYLGVRAVLARSFERIHAANLVNFGIVPLVIDEQVYAALAQGVTLTVSGIVVALRSRTPRVPLLAGGKPLGTGTLQLSERQMDVLLAGGTLRYNRTA
ncbi:MAG TPA: aconitate hydratase [bacterium]|nr:aconitate hydratase [bacterium]